MDDNDYEISLCIFSMGQFTLSVNRDILDHRHALNKTR